MNVFEDLIVELKQENLLEDTVFDEMRYASPNDVDTADITDEPNASKQTSVGSQAISSNKKDNKDFFSKRAVNEVSSLQMVEHVVTGVEREYLKVVPKAFDDFNAKKALNAFLQVAEASTSEEYKRAEFDLMQETQAWATALSERDHNIPVWSLRQYCENSKPALSSHAMLALGRFYRNSPYSESVRAKFDFVVTRLFSRPGQQEHRVLLFDSEEMLEHVKTLYADWSSVPLYTADADESNVLLAALSFEDLAREAENATNFDQLIRSDFFGRVRIFKDSISELFYAPRVTVAAIDCNIRIGNAYVRLIEREQNTVDPSGIQAKYGDLDNRSVSDAAGGTLDLAEIIRQRNNALQRDDRGYQQAELAVGVKRSASPSFSVTARPDKNEAPAQTWLGRQIRSVNKWVLILAGVILLLSGSLFIWANFFAGEDVPSNGVRAIAIEDTPLAGQLRSAKVSGDTLYGLLTPSWEALPKQKRIDFLQLTLQIAKIHGAKQVQLITKDGKQAAFASDTRMDIDMP